MRPDAKVVVSAGTLAAMTAAQFEALQKNVLAEGHWDSAWSLHLSGRGGYIAVQPLDKTNAAMIFLGIEEDGYTHS